MGTTNHLGSNMVEMMRILREPNDSYKGKIRQIDVVLTNILQNEYGKLLGYYPPVFFISKCLEFWRPYFLECASDEEFRDKLIVVSDECNQDEEEASDEKDCSSEDSTVSKSQATKEKYGEKPKRKSLKWFFGRKPKIEDDGQNSKNSEQEEINDFTDLNQETKPEETSEFYPTEASDVDEEDDSDVEGEYNFYNEDEDNKSIGDGSVQSQQEMIDSYEKELKIKLMENYVNDNTKEKVEKPFNKRGSLRRLFGKAKK